MALSTLVKGLQLATKTYSGKKKLGLVKDIPARPGTQNFIGPTQSRYARVAPPNPNASRYNASDFTGGGMNNQSVNGSSRASSYERFNANNGKPNLGKGFGSPGNMSGKEFLTKGRARINNLGKLAKGGVYLAPALGIAEGVLSSDEGINDILGTTGDVGAGKRSLASLVATGENFTFGLASDAGKGIGKMIAGPRAPEIDHNTDTSWMDKLTPQEKQDYLDRKASKSLNASNAKMGEMLNAPGQLGYTLPDAKNPNPNPNFKPLDTAQLTSDIFMKNPELGALMMNPSATTSNTPDLSTNAGRVQAYQNGLSPTAKGANDLFGKQYIAPDGSMSMEAKNPGVNGQKGTFNVTSFAQPPKSNPMDKYLEDLAARRRGLQARANQEVNGDMDLVSMLKAAGDRRRANESLDQMQGEDAALFKQIVGDQADMDRTLQQGQNTLNNTYLSKEMQAGLDQANDARAYTKAMDKARFDQQNQNWRKMGDWKVEGAKLEATMGKNFASAFQKAAESIVGKDKAGGPNVAGKRMTQLMQVAGIMRERYPGFSKLSAQDQASLAGMSVNNMTNNGFIFDTRNTFGQSLEQGGVDVQAHIDKLLASQKKS